jgi:Mce-associated membrane protein
MPVKTRSHPSAGPRPVRLVTVRPPAEADAEKARPTMTQRLARWLPSALPPLWPMVAALALALGLLTWSGLRWWDARQVENAHEAALTAARQATVNFVTISASSVDSDLQRVVDGATGDFKSEFTQDMAQVRQAVVENQVASTGEVLRAGVVSGDRHSAVVLVAVDASVKNTGAPDGRLLHYRIQVDLVLDHDRWLVSKLSFVG